MFIYILIIMNIIFINNICYSAEEKIFIDNDRDIIDQSSKLKKTINTECIYEDIYKLRADGMTRSQIRKQLNITEAVINRAIVKHGDYKIRKPVSIKTPIMIDIPEEITLNIQRLSKMGQGRKKISKALGVSDSIVKRSLKKIIEIKNIDIIESIYKLKDEGKKVKEIAETLDISIGNVFSTIHKKHNATYKNKATPTYTIEPDIEREVKKLWLAKAGQTKICSTLNIPVSLTKRIIKQLKVKQKTLIDSENALINNDTIFDDSDDFFKYDSTLLVSPLDNSYSELFSEAAIIQNNFEEFLERLIADDYTAYDSYSTLFKVNEQSSFEFSLTEPNYNLAHKKQETASVFNYYMLCPALHSQDFINHLCKNGYNKPTLPHFEASELYKKYIFDILIKIEDVSINFNEEIIKVMFIFDEMFEDIIQPFYELKSIIEVAEV